MAEKKKTAKKVEEKTEKKGEEVKSAPAVVEEAVIKVRGTAVGGVKMMTQSEFDKYCGKK